MVGIAIQTYASSGYQRRRLVAGTFSYKQAAGETPATSASLRAGSQLPRRRRYEISKKCARVLLAVRIGQRPRIVRKEIRFQRRIDRLERKRSLAEVEAIG